MCSTFYGDVDVDDVIAGSWVALSPGSIRFMPVIDPLVSAQATKALLRGYARLHRRMMDPDDPSPKRFYVANGFPGNNGNHAMVLLCHLVLAIKSGRALVMDDDALPVFDWPLRWQLTQVPRPWRNTVLNKTHSNVYKLSWMAKELILCRGDVFASIHSNRSIFAWPAFAQRMWRHNDHVGAPDLARLLANPIMATWFNSHVGDHGLRHLMRWLFSRPKAPLLADVRAMESSLCGQSPCDIGVHIRRGRTQPGNGPFPDLYFPETGDDAREYQKFATCVERIVRAKRLPPKPAVIVASDNVDAIAHVQADLRDRARVAWVNGSIRINGGGDRFYGSSDPLRHSHFAWLDLIMVSRARYFIGTRSSTFSMLAAGMNTPDDSSSWDHWMVYPGVYDGCIRASSAYNSFSHFETLSQLAAPNLLIPKFSGPSSRNTSCGDESLVDQLQAIGGTFNPHVETLDSVIAWDDSAHLSPSTNPTRVVRQDVLQDDIKRLSALMTLQNRIADRACVAAPCPDTFSSIGVMANGKPLQPHQCIAPSTYVGPCSRTPIFSPYHWTPVEQVDWARRCNASWEACEAPAQAIRDDPLVSTDGLDQGRIAFTRALSDPPS